MASDGQATTRSDKLGEAPSNENSPVFIIVMGVSGTGKSTLGAALAKDLGLPFIEGDDLHPKANINKMSAGVPLNDADREPWLELIRKTAEDVVVHSVSGDALEDGEVVKVQGDREGRKIQGVVAGCSSLKAYYREILRGNLKPSSPSSSLEGSNGTGGTTAQIPPHLAPPSPSTLPTCFVYIHGTRDVMLDRMEKRPGHFMKASMLDSQLNTLEDPRGENGVVAVPLTIPTEEQVKLAKEGLSKFIGVDL